MLLTLLLLFFSFSSPNIILIPFKILNKNSLNNSKVFDPFLFIKNKIDNILYSELYIGEPPEKMTAIITFYSTDLEMHSKITKDLFIDTLYRRNKSKTYKEIFFEKKNDIFSSKHFFKEQLKFYNDINFKNLITVNELNFSIFEYNKKEEENSFCFNIGFKLLENIDNQNDINTNLIIQLKQKNIISSYNFNFHYKEININGELYNGYITIGEEPHHYLTNTFNELQLFKTKAFKRDNILSWDIYFNKIYFKLNEKEYILDNGVEYFNEVALTPSSGVIVGTKTYESYIKKLFFNELIKEKKCFKINKENQIFYYCDKNKINEDIKNFPSIYFYNAEFNYIFELDYEDLFLEKSNILFFLVIFYDYPEQIQDYFNEYVSRWDFGTPFLNKYFLTFDYDNKYIGFYNNNCTIQNSFPNSEITNKNKISKNKYYIGIILVIIILFLFIGIFIVKKNFAKKKKVYATELESEIINDSNKQNSKYYNIEMGEKNLLYN